MVDTGNKTRILNLRIMLNNRWIAPQVAVSIMVIHFWERHVLRGARNFDRATFDGMANLILSPESTHGASARILCLLSSLTYYLLFVHYTCDLTSRMTTGTEHFPIQSIGDALEKGYQVTTLKDSSYQTFFEEARNGIHQYIIQRL
jgi:hypothetical protein